MKLLYYSRQINEAVGAGVHGRMFVETAKRLDKNLVVYPPVVEDLNKSNKERTSRLRKSLPPTLAEFLVLLRAFILSPFYAARLIQVYRGDKFTGILMRLQGIDFGVLLASRLLQIPIILEVNAPIALEKAQVQKPGLLGLYGFYERLMWRNALHFFVVSEILKNYLIRNGVDAQRICVVPNGVNIDQFSPARSGAAIRKSFSLEEKMVLLFSGSPMPWHDLATLFTALVEIRKEGVCLIILGDSEYIEGYQALTEQLGIREKVIFLGRVDHQLVPEFLAAADILVAPYKKTEVFYFSPLKLLEYMAMGKPIIASNIGQISKLLSDDCGLLVQPENVTELTAAIQQILSAPDVAIRMGRKAREKVSTCYKWEDNVTRIIEQCTAILGDHRH